MKPIPVFKGRVPKPITSSPPPTPAEDTGYWRFKRTAKWLDVSERFLSEEMRLGRIRVTRFGKLVRFDPADVKAYAEGRKSGGSTPIFPERRGAAEGSVP